MGRLLTKSTDAANFCNLAVFKIVEISSNKLLLETISVDQKPGRSDSFEIIILFKWLI